MSQSLMLDRISEPPIKVSDPGHVSRLKSFKDPILFRVTVKLIEGKGKGVAREGRGKAAMTDTFREEQKLVEGLAKHLRFESRGSWLRGVMESVSMRMIKEKDWYELLRENQRLTPPLVPKLYLAARQPKDVMKLS
ncbi:hypothetical protein H0E87_001682 [Populus deltoides]|uniref:Uncharacterized protein n=1 Tax=Populus deltoides TaxID=3696 RepID=A0A8T2ZSM6_POPDE|nr:hypothetical protein H0E87_001682 [Populus deltoides]